MEANSTVHKLFTAEYIRVACRAADRRLKGVPLDRRAFTLVELIIVVGILGILALMAMPAFNSYIEMTREKRCLSDIVTIERAIEAYVIDKNALPDSLSDIKMDGQLDPWGRPYRYNKNVNDGTALEYPGGTGDVLNTDYDLYSTRADLPALTVPNATSENDIVRMNNGAIVGPRPI
jgi:general secretion pathway protein G